MSKQVKSNPADKLNLPEPPDGCYWHVYDEYFLGIRMGLYRKRKYWFDSRIEDRGPSEYYTDDTVCPLERGLEHAAEVIMERIHNREKYFNDIRNLYDTKVYLDELVPARELSD